MKRLITILAIALVAIWCLPQADAQTLSITYTSSTLSASTAVLNGPLTLTNLVVGLTNSASVTVFWGGSNGGTDPATWANYTRLSASYTNGMLATNTLTGLTPNSIYYFRARAQDLDSEVWSTASTIFTTSTQTAWSPGKTFLENTRTGLFNTVQCDTAIIVTQKVSVIVTGNVPYAVSIDTTTNSAGAAIKVLKLTP